MILVQSTKRITKIEAVLFLAPLNETELYVLGVLDEEDPHYADPNNGGYQRTLGGIWLPLWERLAGWEPQGGVFVPAALRDEIQFWRWTGDGRRYYQFPGGMSIGFYA